MAMNNILIKELPGTIKVTVRLSRRITWRIRCGLALIHMSGWVLPLGVDVDVLESGR